MSRALPRLFGRLAARARAVGRRLGDRRPGLQPPTRI